MTESYSTTLFYELLKINNVPKKIDIKYECLSCNFLLNDKQEIIDHASEFHPTTKDKIIFRIVYAIKFNENPQMKIMYQCSICNVFINKKEDLMSHFLQIHSRNTNYINNVETKIGNDHLDYSGIENNSKSDNENVFNRKGSMLLSLVDMLGQEVCVESVEVKELKISLGNNEQVNIVCGPNKEMENEDVIAKQHEENFENALNSKTNNPNPDKIEKQEHGPNSENAIDDNEIYLKQHELASNIKLHTLENKGNKLTSMQDVEERRIICKPSIQFKEDLIEGHSSATVKMDSKVKENLDMLNFNVGLRNFSQVKMEHNYFYVSKNSNKIVVDDSLTKDETFDNTKNNNNKIITHGCSSIERYTSLMEGNNNSFEKNFPKISLPEDNRSECNKPTESSTNIVKFYSPSVSKDFARNIVLDWKGSIRRTNTLDEPATVPNKLNENLCNSIEIYNKNALDETNSIRLRFNLGSNSKNISKNAQCGRNKSHLGNISIKNIKYLFSKEIYKNMVVPMNVIKTIWSEGEKGINFSLPFKNLVKMRDPAKIGNPSKFNFTKLKYMIKFADKPSLQLKNNSLHMNSNLCLRNKRTSEVLDNTYSNKMVISNDTNENFGSRTICKKVKLNDDSLPRIPSFTNSTSCVQSTITKSSPEAAINFIDPKNLLINYKCFVCFRNLPTEILLYKHINTKHFEIRSFPHPIIKIRFECVYCYAHYNTKIGTINHIKFAHSNRNKINEITIRPLIVSTNRLLRIRCLICNKSFENIVYYRTHIERHRNSPLASCYECAKKYYNPVDLSTHLRTHLKAGKILCQYCGVFYSRNGFKKHVLVHKSSTNYICNICDKTFAKKNLLNSHRETHYNVRSFKCDFCEKLFYTSCYLRHHIKKQHMVKQSRTYYSCVVCKQIFARRILLQNHKESHAKIKNKRCKKF